MLYVSSNGKGESIWKIANGTGTELWRGVGARMIGAPAVSADGTMVAFSVRQQAKAMLYVMRPDGTDARVVSDALEFVGSPAWTPDGKWITAAADVQGVPHLFRIPVNGGSASMMVDEYAMDPTWAPDGRFVLYSGPDVGTTFPVKAATPEKTAYALPTITLTRGARHLVFWPGGQSLVVLRGEIRHKNLWLIDLQTGAERKLTDIPGDFEIQDFDVSPDGKEVVLNRVQEQSDVVVADLHRP
jgi:Tol biopolymer transport system component